MSDVELIPTPRDERGAALRVRTPIENELRACCGPESLAKLLSQRRMGQRRVVHGVDLVPVTIAAWAPGERKVLCHLNGFTDCHREDYRPSLLERVLDSDVLAATWLLPADGVLTYRLADVTGLPHDIGSERAGWKLVHERGGPDPTMPLQLPTPLGGRATIWHGPDVRPPEWHAKETETWMPVVAGDRTMSVLPGDERVLVLFDGQFWTPLGVGAALRRAGFDHTVVLVPSTMDRRARDLTDGASAARLMRTALEAASRVIKQDVRRAEAVVGQSFGGLAVAGLALDHSDLLRLAIVQSGSFWYPNAYEHSDGALVDRLTRGEGSTQVPVVVQVGSEEGQMVYHSRRYRDALLARGGSIIYKETRGGHDYAWWRYGLLEALRAASN